MATTEERLAQLEHQQSLQSEAIAQILANNYQSGPTSSKGLLVQLNPDKFEGLAVVEMTPKKADAPAPDGGIEAVWIGSPNHYNNDLHAVVACVIHTMAGTLSSCDSWFNNPSSQVSSHFGTGLDAQLHQYVQLQNGAWANGILEAGNKWQARYGTENPNHRTISIETEDLGSGSTPVSEGEYQATLEACRLAVGRWPSIEVVTSHHVISPQSRPQCCGSRWIASGQLGRLAAEMGLELFI